MPTFKSRSSPMYSVFALFVAWISKDGKIAYKNTKVIPAQDAKAITEFIASAEKK